MSDLALPVQLYDRAIGTLSRVNGAASFEWAHETGWRQNSTALSTGLPFGRPVSVDAAENFFGALLPEGQWRTKLSTETGAGENDVVGLLGFVGADVAGALTIGDRNIDEQQARAIGTDDLREMLANSAGYTVGGGGSTLPGYQRKLALTRQGGHWVNGHGAIASTHILKPVKADAATALISEDYSLKLGRVLGLTTFDSWLEEIDGLPVLVLERYDRHETGDGVVQRIHQEDMAQAFSLPWRGDDKFEQNNPGSTLAAFAARLDEGRTIFARGESDKRRLLRYVTFNVAIGNTDAHAKNFSILRPDGQPGQLAPLYDVAPVAFFYDGRKQLAQTINGQVNQPLVTAEDLITEARTWGIDDRQAADAITDTLERLVEATRITPAHDAIRKTIPGYIRGQSQNLLDGKKAQLSGLPPELRGPIGTPAPAE